MKKIIKLLLIIFVFILPVIVQGEECNPGSISITNIELNSISGKAKEISSPTVDNNKINLDLKLNDVGDTVEYNININNSSSENYYIDKDILKDTSEYVDYSLEYDSNIVESNSSKNIKLKVEYKNEVPPVDGDSLELDDTKTISLDLNTNSQEIDVPNTGINIKSLILAISLLIVISLALYKTNKKTYILIGTILLLPVITNAICKTSIEINSNIKIARPVSVTETIYWALQDNNSDTINETLILSSHEIDGVLKGSFAGDTKFTNEKEVPWIAGNYYNANNLSYNVTNVNIDGIVAPTSTAYWFYAVGYNATTFEANLSDLVTRNVTNMSYMFYSAGKNATTWSIGDISEWVTSNVTTWSIGDISEWVTSNVTDMSSMFSGAGNNSTTFNLDLSNFDTSKVTNMLAMFYYTGYNSTNWSIGDLSNWDTSNVTDMSRIFECSGSFASTWDIGDLSKWNVSKVTEMSNMFYYAGSKASTFTLDLSNWDASNVTNMTNMFYNAGHNASSWQITIPKTNGYGINNTTSRMYGNHNSTYATPPSGKSFTLAN